VNTRGSHWVFCIFWDAQVVLHWGGGKMGGGNLSITRGGPYSFATAITKKQAYQFSYVESFL